MACSGSPGKRAPADDGVGHRDTGLTRSLTMREKTILMVRLLVIVLLYFTWLPSMSYAGGWYLMVAPPKDSKAEHKPDLTNKNRGVSH